ncbi:hypothetical protein THARTR1_01338 [Trichoderma harzianum]|uniref:NACHT-NTPase and P-loop NTPases N-terminal domain-containing protein n=1 Tax=Trichoderma harzianum TaxID=5544 RepID=A0A2K0UMU9_TRIHA|nr:hypothetical protein THARTR1_01338 [Trichoderma harzianum]
MMDAKTTIKEVTTIVAEAIKHHETVKEDRTLGETFYQAGQGLGLIKGALGLFPAEQPTAAIQSQQPTETVEASPPAETVEASPPAEGFNTQPTTGAADTPPSTDTAQDQPSADALLKNCHNDAILLRDLFHKISQAPPTMRSRSYKDFLKENGSDNFVETLVLNLMQNICRLAKNYGIKEEQLKGLHDAITKLKSMKSSDPNVQKQGSHAYLNKGSGTQFNSTTRGVQNNSTGSGTSFNGSSFHAPMNFGGRM